MDGAYPILKSSSGTPLLFYMVDSADHISAKTGLSPTVTISKNGGSFGSPSGAVSEIANGWYKVAGNGTDTGSEGPIALHATASGADPFDDVVAMVVEYNPMDAVRLGLTALPNANAEAAGGLYTRGSGAGQINQNANGQVDTRWVAGNVTVGTNNDKTGYTASTVSDKTGYSLSSAGIQAIWDALTSALTTVGSIGKLLVDNINATISSRSTYAGGAVASVTAAVTVGTNNDKTGYSLAADQAVNVTKWSGTTVATPNTAGVPIVDTREVVRQNTAQATGNSTTAIKLDASASATTNFYKYMVIRIISGTGAGEYALCTAYDGSTKIATVAPAWPTAPDNTSVFQVVALGVADVETWLATAVTAASAGIPDVNAKNLGGTAQTGRDVGASVLLSSGTGTGQLDFTSGVVKANLAQILGTALTETAGQIAAGFKKFFNIASPAATMDHLVLVDTATNINQIESTDATDQLDAHAGGSDPWATAVPGSYSSGQAGYVLGHNLDAQVSAVKSKTDNLPASPAATGDAMTLADGAITAAKIASNAITAAKIATDAVGAAQLASDAVAEIQSGLSTYAGGDTAGTTTLLSRLTATRAGYLDNLSGGAVALATKLTKYVQLLTRKDAAIATDNATELTAINADGGSGAGGYDNTTDSEEAQRDNVGTAGAGLTAADDATITAIGALNNLSQANVRTAVGLGSANLDTQLSTLATASALSTVAGYVDTEVAAIKAKTDNLPASPAATSDIPSAASIADAVWDETLADHLGAGSTGEALDGAGGGSGGATASEIADAVWDEARAGHTTSGTFGQGVASVQGNVTGSVASLTTNNDKTGYALNSAYDPAKTAAQAGDAMTLTTGERTSVAAAIWNALTSGLSTVGSIGKLLVDNVNATISSRLASASYTAPLDAAATRSAVGLTSANLDTQLAAIQADTDNLQTRVPASLVSGRMDASVGAVANNAIADAGVSTDLDTYQATVDLIDDDANDRDRWLVNWFKNSQPVESGITSPTIRVWDESGADVIAATAMTEMGSQQSFKYVASGFERLTSGSAYMVRVTATIDGSTRVFRRPMGRDSAA